MRWVARARWVLARRPWIYWSLVALCTLVVCTQVAAAQSRADAQRHAWGTSRRVWVAAAPASPGQRIATVERDLPEAMVPADALTHAPDRPAAQRISRGEVLVTADLTDPSLAAGWVVFAVPRASAPAVAPGDGVAVFGDGSRLCDGRVTAAADDTVDVAVPPDCAAATSAQVHAGTVVLARRAGG